MIPFPPVFFCKEALLVSASFNGVLKLDSLFHLITSVEHTSNYILVIIFRSLNMVDAIALALLICSPWKYSMLMHRASLIYFPNFIIKWNAEITEPWNFFCCRIYWTLELFFVAYSYITESVLISIYTHLEPDAEFKQFYMLIVWHVLCSEHHLPEAQCLILRPPCARRGRRCG